ncbi:Sterol regulatory element-binding protein cleavage-activating protein [Aphelenchoides bicaudatus]|nr:Sterol regulatory element-binding protein cleavage-activating protein [Aphelenchoides bicaudatus]
MVVVRFVAGRKLEDRINRVFYDYGRLCAAHPKTCLSISIITILFLSYPAISKLSLPISSPMDVYWDTVGDDLNASAASAPEWWIEYSPAVYIQHIIVKGKVEPWFGNLSAVAAVRGSIYTSFNLLKILNETTVSEHIGLADFCFRGKLTDKQDSNRLLPHKSCVLLSPTLFWRNNFELFEKDVNVVNTIFRHHCSPAMCPRDILLGTPTRLTGIKQNYRTNRQRSIDYAVTLIQMEYNAEWRKAVIERLSTQYKIVESHGLDEETAIHVFYRPREYISDYLPLLVSYFLCALYFYYTVNKFQMVKSKTFLALASFLTVATTLSSTSGICAYFELNASLWRASVFPYLAMILGLENVLCITRSVVYIPPSLDVPTRLAHGLSMQGNSITKYFFTELLLLLLGYLTKLPQIQEFCVFAFIGIVVDLYMQLFFYTPCLAFDLYRMDGEDKQRFALMLFDVDIRQLKKYPAPRCPARYFFPSLFTGKNRLIRAHSETNISKNDGSTTITYKGGHRRSMSTDKNLQQMKESNSVVSNRLRVLYFWTKRRLVQRVLIGLFFVWVIWLAFMVHKWQIFGMTGSSTNVTTHRNNLWTSQNIFDSAPLEFGHYIQQTFRWWPALFAEYNLSLSGRYITFLPPVIIESVVNAANPILTPKRRRVDPLINVGDQDMEDMANPELKNRVYWLEYQMTTMLVFSALIPFTVVVLFTLYACCWDKLSIYQEARRSAAQIKTDKRKELTDKKGFIELTPLVFSRHEAPIECACVDVENTIVSASVTGLIFLWDSSSGELRNSIQRPSTRANAAIVHPRSGSQSFIPNEPSPKTKMTETHSNITRQAKSLIWCLTARKNIIALGCSNGVVQMANSITARIIGTFDENLSSGITHIQLKPQRMCFVRLNGVLEVVEYRLTEGPLEEQRAEFRRLSASKVHKRPITQLIYCTWQIITASEDHSLRIFDLRSMSISHTLNGHLAGVASACVSADEELLFSSCEQGRICCWSLSDGQLLRSVDQTTKRFVELACTSTLLVGFGGDSKLWLWDLKDGTTIAELSLQDQVQPLTLLLDIDDGIEQSLREPRFVAVLSDQHIVTSDSDSVHIWDLQLNAIIKQVRLPSFVDSIQRLDESSALCCSGTEMFRISIPRIKQQPTADVNYLIGENKQHD